MRRIGLAAILAIISLAPSAFANVHEQSDRGFVIRHGADVPATPDKVWATLVRPAQWWSAAHTYSQDAKNLSLEARAGGCFCEVLPSKASPNAAPRGGVEHMRVVYAEQGRALRMTGGLGPLQSDAAAATLTIFLRPVDGGTRMLWEYVVGGYVRNESMPSALDAVLGEQIARLAAELGGKPLTTAGEDAGSGGGPRADTPGDTFADAFGDEEAQAEPVVEETPDAPTTGPDIIGR